MRCIVTGGAGFVGSGLISKLCENGISPIVIDPMWFGDCFKELFDGMFAPYRSYNEFNFNDCFKEDDVVIHLGGLSNDPMADYDRKANDILNHHYTKIIAEEFAKAGGRRFIFASSASVYGFRDELVDEEAQLNPQSAYGMSKVAAEQALELLSSQYEHFKPISIRKATIMGPSVRMRFDLVVNAMVASAYKNGVIKLNAGGETFRPLVHINDVIDCYVELINMQDEKIKHSVYNLMHKNYRISELGLYIRDIIQREYNRKIDIITDYSIKECRSYRMIGERLNELGIIPKTGVLKTVQQLWKMLENGIDPTNPVYKNIEWLKLSENVCRCWDLKFNLLNGIGE